MDPRRPRKQKESATYRFDELHLGWIARRARALGLSKTDYLRTLIERDMDHPLTVATMQAERTEAAA